MVFYSVLVLIFVVLSELPQPPLVLLQLYSGANTFNGTFFGGCFRLCFGLWDYSGTDNVTLIITNSTVTTYVFSTNSYIAIYDVS